MVPRLRLIARRLAVCTVFAVLASGPLAHAQAVKPKAVVELFTSQGCSSCPPADALFVELARDPALITLTMPVTYWNYLGWRDTLAQDVFTKRQKHYAKARGDGQVYTPQAVINGTAHCVGTNREAIGKLVSEQAQAGFPVSVGLEEQGDSLKITLAASGSNATKAAGIWLLPVSRALTVPIARGENTGKTITYANVVRGLTRVGDWKGGDATLSVPLSLTREANSDGYVVLVQADEPARGGAVLGAARSGSR